jgi:hypothetical protein
MHNGHAWCASRHIIESTYTSPSRLRTVVSLATPSWLLDCPPCSTSCLPPTKCKADKVDEFLQQCTGGAGAGGKWGTPESVCCSVTHSCLPWHNLPAEHAKILNSRS